MDEKKVNDRFIIIRNILLVVFSVILAKILYMAVFKYEHYTELAENKTYKELPIKAPRGDIRDKNGKILATTKNQFIVQVSADGINKVDSNKNNMANEISLKLINLLEKNKEEYKDEFPIYIKNGKYYYTYDKDIAEYKDSKGIPENLNAKESFYYLVDKLIEEGVLSQEDKKLEPSKLQAKLNKNGEYPPILVSKWLFTQEKNKTDWLASYKINEENISAKDAFNKIKDYYSDKTGKMKTSMPLNEGMSDVNARKVLVVRDLLKSQGYSRYNPVTIAQDISESTISQIEEKLMDLPGVSIANEPVRYYPNGTLAGHVLGHIGKIPSTKESEYLEKGYSKSDLVGLAGIEKSYESQLRGTDGYKKVQVDAVGKITKEIEVAEPKSGDTVYLSLDKNLQEVAEDSLKRTIDYARTGGTFKSQYGDKSGGGTAPNAKSGALIAVDVNTGDVLASVSYPSYDPNLFTKGSISYSEYAELEPENKNDSLSPSKLLNLVTQGVFQPGSTFKMITGMAALENGLDPNYSINDPGMIKYGERKFADYIWHKSRKNHGITNLYKAIQESCNIYFYTIGTGKYLGTGQDLNINMGPNKILEYARLFGLDEATGLIDEIEETPGHVPTTEQKLKSTQTLLKSYLEKNMGEAFTDITKEKNPKEFESRIDEIVGWAAEKNTPGRVEVINRLIKLKVKEDLAEGFADKILFNYLKFAKWSTADTFNLSIGQGENAYTPAQMARYVAAIANGGNLVELSVVKKTISSDYKTVVEDNNKSEKIDFKNSENLKALVQGMKQMATLSSAKSIFGTLPVSVAAKTGTAEKSGKIPTPDEYQYLIDHMGSYGVSKDEAIALSKKLIKEREKELSKEREKEIKEQLKDNKLDEKERKSLEDELSEGVSVKLDYDNDKLMASYLRKAIQQLNPKANDAVIDKFKSDYDAFAWTVAFAPADNPEIAVVVMIPQGNESSYALLPVREVIGAYMGFNKDTEKTTDKNTDEDENITNEEKNINFGSQIKN